MPVIEGRGWVRSGVMPIVPAIQPECGLRTDTHQGSVGQWDDSRLVHTQYTADWVVESDPQYARVGLRMLRISAYCAGS